MKHTMILRVLAVLLICSMVAADLSFAYAAEVTSSAETASETLAPEEESRTLSLEEESQALSAEEISGSTDPSAEASTETGVSPEETLPETQGDEASSDDPAGESAAAEEEAGSQAAEPLPETSEPIQEETSSPEEPSPSPEESDGEAVPSEETLPQNDSVGEESESVTSSQDPAVEETYSEEEEVPVNSPYATEEEAAAMAVLEAALEEAMGRTYTDYSYSTELAKFPDSYQSYLKQLHNEYPNWIFVAVDTGLDWADVITGEYGDNSTIDYNLNGSTHNMLLNNHTGYYGGYSLNGYKKIDGQHVSCSRAAISFYMDPRNFLTYKYPFQFEDLTFNANIQTLAGVESILKAANSSSSGLYHQSLAKYNSTYGDTYAEVIYNVGRTLGISPYYLASKIVQETGATITNDSISGNRSGYTGLYNFYNIGAYPHDGRGSVENGLIYARNHGWTNPILAIYGGAEYIGESYITKGQNTGYYQKFNVSPDSSYPTYTHQYMSSIYSAASEATKTYDAYSKVDALDSSFLFFIPVYSDMPTQDSTVSLTAATTGTLTEQRRIYAEPSTSSSSIVTAPSGAAVQVLGGKVTSTETYLTRLYYPYWYQVKVTVSGVSYTGYVQEQFVSLRSAYTLKPGSTKSVPSILSTSGSVGVLYYETSNPNVATVSDGGIISAVGTGSCKIYAISTGGSFDAIGLTVSSSGSSETAAITLAAPQLSNVTMQNGSVLLQWKQVADATGYTVWRKQGSQSGWSKIATVNSGSTVSYRDSGVESGVTYHYTVRATATSGGKTYNSSYDNTGLSICYLSAPVLKGVAQGSGFLRVTWDPTPGAEFYAVYRKTSSTGWQRVGTVTSTSFDDKTISSSGTYLYTVRAISGAYMSSYNASGVSLSYSSVPELTALSNTTNGLTLTWKADPTATSYVVYRRSGSSGWKQVATTPKTSYVDTSAVSGTTYRYTVRAVINGKKSGYDSTGLSCLRLSTPALSSVSNSSSALRVAWKAVSGAASYKVYRKSSGTGWKLIGNTSQTYYTDRSATQGQAYVYTVRAINGRYQSDYIRSGISCTSLATPELTAAVNIGSAISVSWKQVSGASGYAVYRKQGNSSWKKVATVSSGSTTWYVDASVRNGTKYRYTVRAYRNSSLSGYSSTGVTATASSNVSLTKAVTISACSYYSKMSTGKAAGKVRQKNMVYLVANWSVKSGGTTWYRLKTSKGFYYIPAKYLLSTPTILSASATAGGLTVRWSRDSVCSGYTVWRKTSRTGWKKIATLSSNKTTSYVDKSAVSGTKYTYTVRSYRGSILSRYDTKGVSCTYLSTPELRSATSESQGISLSWTAVSGAAGYRIYRKSSGSGWKQIALSTTASYTDQSSLTSGTSYTYTVRAYSGSNLSYYNTAGISAKHNSPCT